MRSSGSALLVGAAAFAAAVVTASAEAGTLDSPGARGATAVLCGYVAARDHGDFSKASSLTADGVRWLDTEGQNHPKNVADLKAMLSWEQVMGARWRCRALDYADGWLEAEVSEDNRMYEALGVGTLFQRDRVRVEGGQIREGRTLSEWSTGREEQEAFGAFKDWLKGLPESRKAGVSRDGNLIYNAESARRTLPLLDLWEQHHPPARRLLTAALDALGGTDRVAGLDNWIVDGLGRENLSAEAQGLAPDAPTWRPHEERLAVVRSAGAVAWERKTPRNDQSLRWRRFIETEDSFGVVDWTTGFGAMRKRAIPKADREALMRRIPHLLLLDAATSARRLLSGQERLIARTPHDVVEATLSDGTRLSILLARNPPVLARVEYHVYLPGLGDSVVAWNFFGWQKNVGLGLSPSGHRVEVNGTVFQEVAYKRYEAGSGEAVGLMKIPSDLAPEGARRERVPPAGPATGEVASGVHAAEIRGFLTYFVEFADFVVVFDAPASAVGLEAIPAAGSAECERVAEELLAAIERTCPAKPVRFLVVSHHHSDHLGGLRAFIRPGVTILAAPGHVAAVRRALTAAHTLAPDRWNGDGQQVAVEAVPDRREIGDGRRRLEIVSVGQNPHTADNLFAWLPEEKILIQGDLFYYEEGAPFPPSGRETMNRFFARWLDAHSIAPKALYGVHYAGAAGPEALARAAR